MERWRDNALRLARFVAEAAAETLWPTRCALCDAPGEVLCPACARDLPFLDWWRACRRCGSPWGLVQCDACNEVALGRIGRESLPYEGCASATLFSDATGQLVRVLKDQGEQRLAPVLARYMARVRPWDWSVDGVTFVPATLSAVRHRGFDHAELIARALAAEIDAPLICALERPKTRDQRTLTGRQRIENLAGRFAASPAPAPMRLLLVDDVYTTGATVCAAADALHDAGFPEVRVLTFARV